MLNADNGEKLKDILNILETNFQRLNFAFSRTEKLMPFSKSILQNLEPEQISFIDQYIFRFAKIQDMMGEKLFRMILEAVEEETDSLAFIDVLNKLEKLEVLPDKTEWLYLRKLRNEVSHEYPSIDDMTVSILNNIFSSKDKLTGMYRSCIDYLEKRKII
jgi:uncharacterized protein YutE (UPF0331/DUF86 family)